MAIFQLGAAADAAGISYDNATSQLEATDVQAAIDEVADYALNPLPTGNTTGDVLTWNNEIPAWLVGAPQPVSLVVNSQNGDYTLQQSDQGAIVVLTASTTHDFTVPAFGENAYFATGAVIYLANVNTGEIHIQADVGVTVHGVSALTTQGAVAMLVNISQDEWVAH